MNFPIHFSQRTEKRRKEPHFLLRESLYNAACPSSRRSPTDVVFLAAVKFSFERCPAPGWSDGKGRNHARHEIRDIVRWIRVRHNTGWHVTIRVAWLASVGDRAICPRPLLSATQSVPRACIVDLKLASASASAYRRSRGVEHVFDLTGWREPPLTGVEPTHQPRLIVESVEPDLAQDVMSAYRRCTSNSIHVCQ